MLVANHRPGCNTKSKLPTVHAFNRSLSAEEYERVSPSEIAGDVLMRAMLDDRLDRPCLIVLAEIATALDPSSRTFWFGREQIADKTGLALQSVSNCLSRLKAAGHIDSCRRVTPRSNGNTLMHYELAGLPADEDVAPRPEAVQRAALSSSVRLAVWDKTSGRCVYCACRLTREPGQPNTFHADHVLSVRNGGSDDIANLIPSCATCNSRKSAKPFLAFIEEMGGACD